MHSQKDKKEEKKKNRIKEKNYLDKKTTALRIKQENAKKKTNN